VVLVLALLHLRQLRQRGTMTAQLLMLRMLLLLVVFQLLLLVPRNAACASCNPADAACDRLSRLNDGGR
jgi:hypothetical protein